METIHEKARKLHASLLRAGFRSYYDEDRALLFKEMAALEVTLGIPNVLPPGAQGDVLIQFGNEAGKLSSDLVRVSSSSDFMQVLMACNAINSQLLYTRLYLQPAELVVVADRDFMYSDDSYCERIASYLPRFKQDVIDAYPLLQKALSF